METQKVEQQKAAHPWKSTTHEERFYHFQQLGVGKFAACTVFARKEIVPGQAAKPNEFDSHQWFISVAMYVRGDPAPFSRKVGRGLARRKYFSSARHRHPIAGDLTHDKVVEKVACILRGANHPPGHAQAYVPGVA